MRYRLLRSQLRFLRRLLLAWVGLLLVQGPVLLLLAHLLWPQPQAILTLGGRMQRETYTARFALAHRDLPIWISSGLGPERVRPMFQSLGIGEDRLTLDYRAVDTVTNFTTLVPVLKARHIHHLYLITSDFHMPRATAIATIVLGSNGIAFTPVPVISLEPPESRLRIARDMARSWLWLATRWTGANLRDPWMAFSQSTQASSF